MNLRDVIPTAENSSNFNVVPESITEVGTTLENLKAAVCGDCLLYTSPSPRDA